MLGHARPVPHESPIPDSYTHGDALMTLAPLPTSEREIPAYLDGLWRTVHQNRLVHIGFPIACDIDYSELAPFFNIFMNNIGDPWTDPAGSGHTKHLEREVLEWFAQLVQAPGNDWWGYLTNGGTEGNLFGMYLARSRFPDALVYYSEASHYSVPKALDIVGLTGIPVRTDDSGEMDYDDLAQLVSQHRHRPVVIVANAGTTMTEAIDDTVQISAILRENAVRARHLHVDAALSGVPLTLSPTTSAGLRLGATMDSISVSGHKFLGTPIPCGVVLTRRAFQQRIGSLVDYTATLDTTITGSRGGQVALLLWYALRRYGVKGHRARAEAAQELASYAVRRLNDVGCNAWRHPHAFTVVFDTPPAEVTDRWILANSGGRSHIVCMPGVSRAQIDGFVGDVSASLAAGRRKPTTLALHLAREAAVA